MQFSAFGLLAFSPILIMAAGCGKSESHRVVSGERKLGFVKFPQPWLKDNGLHDKTNGELVMSLPARYLLRTGNHEIMVRLQANDGSESDNYQAIGLDGSFAVRTGGRAEEWSNAAPLAAFRRALPVTTGVTAAAHDVLFKGRTYRASGQYWGAALPSVQAERLALISFSSSVAPRSILPQIGGGEPSEGTVYIDVYDTGAERKVASGSSQYSGFGPQILGESAFWAGQFFVVPLDYLSQKCFLAIL